MSNISQELISVINQSTSIMEEEKKLWQEAIDGLPEKFCSDILEFIKSEADGLKILTNSLKDKLNAIRNQDMTELENIFSKDKQFLESLKK